MLLEDKLCHEIHHPVYFNQIKLCQLLLETLPCIYPSINALQHWRNHHPEFWLSLPVYLYCFINKMCIPKWSSLVSSTFWYGISVSVSFPSIYLLKVSGHLTCSFSCPVFHGLWRQLDLRRDQTHLQSLGKGRGCWVLLLKGITCLVVSFLWY